MEPAERESIKEIWAILRDVAAREDRAELRHQQAVARLDRAEARLDRAERRMEKYDERMEKYDQRMEKYEERMEKYEQRMEKYDERMEKYDRRMEKYDQGLAKYDERFEATRRLVEGGIKFVRRRDERWDAQLASLAQTVDKLAKAQQAFLDSLRKGGNGNGRRLG